MYVIRRRRPVIAGTTKFRRPDKLTPFTLMLLLETIREDKSLQLEVAEQESLNATIGDLERSYFYRNHNGENGLDLETVCDDWFERVPLRLRT
jgi:hypothetical protein